MRDFDTQSDGIGGGIKDNFLEVLLCVLTENRQGLDRVGEKEGFHVSNSPASHLKCSLPRP